MKNEFVWTEKYRPQTINDCILPENIKKTFENFLDKGEVPNLLLSGPPGCGKTTVAKALCNQLGVDFYVINGSDEGRFLDTVRNNAKNFASTVSLSSEAKHKVVIIDEADNTTPDVQLCVCPPNTKLLLLMKQTTLPLMYSFVYELLRKSLWEIVGLSSLATTKIKSLSPSIQDAQLLTSELKENRNKKSLPSSSKDLTGSWTTSGFKVIRSPLPNSSTNTSQTGEES